MVLRSLGVAYKLPPEGEQAFELLLRQLIHAVAHFEFTADNPSEHRRSGKLAWARGGRVGWPARVVHCVAGLGGRVGGVAGLAYPTPPILPHASPNHPSPATRRPALWKDPSNFESKNTIQKNRLICSSEFYEGNE